MNNKDYIKKSGLVVLSATVLLSNAPLVNAETYKLNNSVQVYKKSSDAKNRLNTVRTIQKGEYHIFKQYNGMLNITKEEGVAGGWINPSDNIKNANNKQNNLESNKYILNNNVKAYIDSDDANSKINHVAIYNSGEYYIYRRANGMINISKTKNSPGAWINPSDNKNTDDNLLNSGKYRLEKNVDGYINSFDAKSNKNPVMKVSSGNYYIYRKYNGMINITKDESSAGVWINPLVNEEVKSNNEEIEKKENPKVEKDISNNKKYNQVSTYIVKSNIPGYSNAKDAKNNTNSVREVKKGNYYIYKYFDSMLNISKDKNAGVWINPNDNIKETKRIQESQREEEIEKLSYDEIVDKYVDNKLSEKDLEIKEIELEEIKDSIIEKLSKSEKDEVVKLSFDKETVDETIEETIDDETIEESIDEETIVEESIDEKELETTENNVSVESEEEVEDDQEVETYTLDSKAKAYISLEDAKNRNNSIQELDEGSYYIYDKKDSMINLSTEKGKEGLWINPIKGNKQEIEEVDEEKEEASEKLEVGSTYTLEEDTKGYLRATDALTKRNEKTELVKGKYYIYKMEAGLINITKDINQPGAWINVN